MRVPKSLRQHPPLWVVHALREGSHLLGAFHSQAASTQFYQNIFWKFVHLKQNCDPTSQEVCPYLHFEERPTQTEMLSVFVRLCPCQRLYQEFENFLKYWPIFSSSFSPQRALTKPSFPHPWVVSSDVHDALAKCLDSLNPSCTPSPVPHSENGLVIHHLRNFLNLFFGYDSMMISFSQWVKHRRSESHSIFLNMLRPSQTVLIFFH